MKRMILILIMTFGLSVFASEPVGKLNLGDNAVFTDVKMLDVSGKMVSIDDVKKENGVLVLFSCNTCPFVLRWEGRYNGLMEWADQNKVGFIVLNSNYQKRDGDDSYKSMQQHAADKKYDFYYAIDQESLIANGFGGQVTPHAFLFDKNYKLVYKGAIDDNYESASEVKKNYIKDAIASLSAGKEIAIRETPPIGCSIKRKLD